MPAPGHYLSRTGRSARVTGHGFTLVELLVVLAIIAILATMTVPAIQGIMTGVNLKGSSNVVYGQFDLARQAASTRNVSVDVRIYASDGSGTAPYRTLAVVIPAKTNGTAADEFLGVPAILQGDVIFDSNTTFSSILDITKLPTASPAQPQTESTSAPLAVRGKQYIYFTFLPNGTLNLSTSVAWSLTLINQHAKAATNSNAPAANYVTFLLDVPTARARIFQP